MRTENNDRLNDAKSGLDPELLRRLDRVVLADVKKAWSNYQSTRDRGAIYGYLHEVFMQVDWWSKNPQEKAAELQAFMAANPNVGLPTDEYAAVIMCTADRNKVGDKMRSRWSRVLRYAAEYKPPNEIVRDFMQRKGGINKCASRYARRLRRNARKNDVRRTKSKHDHIRRE
jgi:hypothetical protein